VFKPTVASDLRRIGDQVHRDRPRRDARPVAAEGHLNCVGSAGQASFVVRRGPRGWGVRARTGQGGV